MKPVSLSSRRMPGKLYKWLLSAFNQCVPFFRHEFVDLFSDISIFIEGSIFWCYGLTTFARFLGWNANLGWAWNRLSSEDYYTAEFVESFVIFLYGATNTWMERFGASRGDPFTTKQIQHISIAVRISIFCPSIRLSQRFSQVMFCFAGLLGMGIESRRIRNWLAHSVFPSSHSSNLPQEAIEELQSYRGSFNPFPALVIGVTGAAMSAHAQNYVFQARSLFRCR